MPTAEAVGMDRLKASFPPSQAEKAANRPALKAMYRSRPWP